MTDSSFIHKKLGYQAPTSIAPTTDRASDGEFQDSLLTEIQHSANVMVLLDPELEDRIVATSDQ